MTPTTGIYIHLRNRAQPKEPAPDMFAANACFNTQDGPAVFYVLDGDIRSVWLVPSLVCPW